MIRVLALILCTFAASCSTTSGTLIFIAEGNPDLTPTEAQAVCSKFEAIATLSSQSGHKLELARLPEDSGIIREYVGLSYEDEDGFFVMVQLRVDGNLEIPEDYMDQFASDAGAALSVLAGREVKVREISFDEFLRRTREDYPPAESLARR